MKTGPATLSVSRKRAARARSRIVFLLLRRALRRLAARAAKKPLAMRERPSLHHGVTASQF